eukprot:1290784-Prymnesium_polylepis.1
MNLKFHIGGIDGNDPKTKENKIPIITWHSSKGLEFKNVIVFGVNAYSEQRPFHVAMTRCQEELIIIQDKESVSENLMRGISESIDHVRTDAYTKSLLKQSYEQPWVSTVKWHKEPREIFDMEHRTSPISFKKLKNILSVSIYRQSNKTEVYPPIIAHIRS